MSIGRVLKVALFVILLTATSNSALAQVSTAAVNGVVQDPAGASIPNAAVTLSNVATGVEHRSTTNEVGAYAFLNVPPGDYTLSATAKGFKTLKLAQFTLVVNQTARFDLNLEVGEVQSSVTVEAAGAAIQTATAELGAAVNETSVKALPLNGRNFSQLLWLAPGAAPISTGQAKGGGYINPVGTFVQPSINGQLNRSNMYLLDGIINVESFMGTYAVAPIIDAIQEFKVQSHNDQPEFGQILGGTVNVVTKAGTNDLHGALWEYIRNDAFDARNTFLAKVNPFKQHMFGV
ncbi:MAG: carboxypeptidase-like regulatory domain-containing protein, partial [Acidobacteriales bacterium]|nr:carboxypeptidase-like regulatory domain-containing protein [Terriglobales bacterium]